MTKEELVFLTLKQLGESLKTTPDNFRLEDPSMTSSSFPGPTIIWQFRLQVEDGKFIPDPLNSVKTIIITYHRSIKQLTCHIYNREVNNLSTSATPEAQAVIQYCQYIPAIFYRTFRHFTTLNNKLMKKRLEKEYVNYLKRLNGIFPATHEDDLFK